MTTQSEKIERLLALLLLQSMKDSNQKEKARILNIAGFSNIEIADFFGDISSKCCVINSSL